MLFWSTAEITFQRCVMGKNYGRFDQLMASVVRSVRCGHFFQIKVMYLKIEKAAQLVRDKELFLSYF